MSELQKRRLGRTGVEVTSFGLGGEGLLRSWSRQAEGVELVWRALELGVTYFDCAHSYAASEDYYGTVWGEHPGLRNNVFMCGKSAEKSKLAARRELELTLRRMKVSHLDLWQIDDVSTPEDWGRISGPGGALEAFMQAHQAGLVRFIGISGHSSPDVLLQALEEFEFDTIAIPVNPAEAKLTGFVDGLLPAAIAKDIGVIGTKVLGGGMLPKLGIPAGSLIRFSLTYPIAVSLVNCGSTEELEAGVAAAQFPFTSDDDRALAVGYDPEEIASYRGILKGMGELPPDMQ